MKLFINDTLNFLSDNWAIVLPILYEILSRVIPTSWNVSIIDNALKLLNLILKNRRRTADDDIVDFKDSTINKVFVERDRHIISSLVIGLVMLSSCAVAQNPLNANALRLVNVTDSTTITSNPATTNPVNFTMFYNRQQGKPRMYFGGIGFDIGSGNGNVTGSFTSGQLPFANGAHSLTSNSTLLWNNASKTLGLFNAGLTLNTSLTPSGLSHTGGLFQIDNSSGSDITVSTLGVGQINLFTANNGLSIFSGVGLGGVVSGRWNVLSGSDNLRMTSSSMEAINTVPGTGLFDITANKTIQIRTSGSSNNDVAIDSEDDIRNHMIGVYVVEDGNNTLTYNAGAVGDLSIFSGVGSGDARITLSDNDGGNVFISSEPTIDGGIVQSPGSLVLNGAGGYNSIMANDSISFITDNSGSPNVMTYKAGGLTAYNGFSIESPSGDIGLNPSGILFATAQDAIILSAVNDWEIGNTSFGSIIQSQANDISMTVADQFRINGIGLTPLSTGYTIDFANTLSLGETLSVQTLTGSSTGQMCMVTSPFNAGVCTCRVSAANTVTIVFHNTTAAPIDPASGTYRVLVFK